MTNPSAGGRFALAIPVFIANAFLLVTLAATALGVIDGLLFQSSMEGTLFALRTQLSGLSLILGFMVLALLILVPHLPKLTLLPA